MQVSVTNQPVKDAVDRGGERHYRGQISGFWA